VRTPYLITVIPLLAETGRASDYDRVLVVDCDERLQRKRLAQRDRSSAAQIDALLGAQATREARRAIADDLIVNDADPGALAPRVRELHAQYLEMAGPH
jgi:dephospho-CoA kinase